MALSDHIFGDQPRFVMDADLGVLADLFIHQRLGEFGLVAFVVAKAAIAPHIDHDIAAELLAVFDGQLAGEGHRFGIVAVDVQDRRLNAFRHIAWIGRGAREFG